MNKLPVFRTFGNAVGFTFGNFFTLFRLSWLPFTALIVMTAALQYVMPRLLFDGEKPFRNPLEVFEKIEALIPIQIASALLQGIVIAAVAVAIHRVILFADRRPGEYFSFAFGKTEFVYFLMAFFWSLIVLAILATAIVPVVYLVSGGDFVGFFEKFKDWPKNAPQTIASSGLGAIGLAYFAAWLVALYVCLRLAVWPPSVVATGRLSPAEPWGLTHGNVWRILGLFVLTFFIIYVLIALPVAAFYYNIAMEAHVAAPAAGVAADPAVMQEAMRQAVERQMERFAPFLPLILFVELLVYVFFTGLTVALVSYSYKALKGYDAREPIPAEA